MSFSFDENLPTVLDYARFRLDDMEEANAYLSNEIYLAQINRFGPREGIAQIASAIAAKISKKITSFGEAAGIRFSKANQDYYESLPAMIRSEPEWKPGFAGDPAFKARVGQIKAANTDDRRYPDVLTGRGIYAHDYKRR